MLGKLLCSWGLEAMVYFVAVQGDSLEMGAIVGLKIVTNLHLGVRSAGKGTLLIEGVLVSVGLIAARHTLHQDCQSG